MEVKLISYSQSSEEFLEESEIESITELVAYCARVSNPENQLNKETNEKLINYLLKHKHFSPFEMVNMCLEITTTRDIARQILRHRSFSFQEFSQRYADPTQMDFVLSEARLQDPKNRQNSVEVDDAILQAKWEYEQQCVITRTKEAYQWAIDHGIAKEQARKVLPEGLTASRMYMNGTLRSWVHFIELRSGNGTQKEHQLIAVECAKVIAKIFPMIEDMVE